MSTIRVNQLQEKSGGNVSTTEEIFNGRARVWWYYEQRTNVGIKNSYRVSSVTDNAQGQYTVNFSDTLSNPCGLSGASYDADGFNNNYSDVANIYAANTYAEVQTPNMGTAAPSTGAGQLNDCNFNYGFIFCDV